MVTGIQGNYKINISTDIVTNQRNILLAFCMHLKLTFDDVNHIYYDLQHILDNLIKYYTQDIPEKYLTQPSSESDIIICHQQGKHQGLWKLVSEQLAHDCQNYWCCCHRSDLASEDILRSVPELKIWASNLSGRCLRCGLHNTLFNYAKQFYHQIYLHVS